MKSLNVLKVKNKHNPTKFMWLYLAVGPFLNVKKYQEGIKIAYVCENKYWQNCGKSLSESFVLLFLHCKSCFFAGNRCFVFLSPKVEFIVLWGWNFGIFECSLELQFSRVHKTTKMKVSVYDTYHPSFKTFLAVKFLPEMKVLLKSTSFGIW